MCLNVEYDYEARMMNSGHRTARKIHHCTECGRDIEPGERYAFWTTIGGEFTDGFHTTKMCAHCEYTIDIGCEFTGCPREWWWEFVHDTYPDEQGFVGDIIHNHILPDEQVRAMMATVIGRQRLWRNPDGTLMELPLQIEVNPQPECRWCEGTGLDRWRVCSCVSDLVPA